MSVKKYVSLEEVSQKFLEDEGLSLTYELLPWWEYPRFWLKRKLLSLPTIAVICVFSVLATLPLWFLLAPIPPSVKDLVAHPFVFFSYILLTLLALLITTPWSWNWRDQYRAANVSHLEDFLLKRSSFPHCMKRYITLMKLIYDGDLDLYGSKNPYLRTPDPVDLRSQPFDQFLRFIFADGAGNDEESRVLFRKNCLFLLTSDLIDYLDALELRGWLKLESLAPPAELNKTIELVNLGIFEKASGLRSNLEMAMGLINLGQEEQERLISTYLELLNQSGLPPKRLRNRKALVGAFWVLVLLRKEGRPFQVRNWELQSKEDPDWFNKKKNEAIDRWQIESEAARELGLQKLDTFLTNTPTVVELNELSRVITG